MITLHMHPDRAPLTWDTFCAAAPAHSIALDGYVVGGPRYDAASPRVNFNHHEEVDRLATRSTCAQVHLAIRQGLFSRFRDEGGARADVYANDCDQDVCLSWYLLKNHYRAEPTMNAALNRLVGVEDVLDATAGAYPYPADMPLLQEVAWIFRPYTQARQTGWLDGRNSCVFADVVDAVCSRVERYLIGSGERESLDTHYEVLRHGHDFVQVLEVGAQPVHDGRGNP
jgi:hypothetical protein